MIWLWWGCASPTDDSGDPIPPEVALAIEDAHVAPIALDFHLAQVEAPEAADSVLDWTAITTDQRGRSVTGEDLAALTLQLVPALTPDELAEAVPRGLLRPGDIATIAQSMGPPEPRSRPLSTFTMGSEWFDPTEAFRADAGTWLLTFTSPNGTDQVWTVLTPVVGAGTPVRMSAPAPTQVSADFEAAAPLALGDATSLDWSGLTLDGRGGPLDTDQLELARVSRFDRPLSELGPLVADLDALASESWSASISGRTSVELAALLDADDAAWPGPDDESTWLLSLGCRACGALVPPVLVAVVPD